MKRRVSWDINREQQDFAPEHPRKPAFHVEYRMDYKHNIRNMSAIAHVNHGKSKEYSLVAAAGIIAQEVAGDVPHTLADEAERGITIKSTGISLYYEMTDTSLKSFTGARDGNEYLINLIDSPGLSVLLMVLHCIEGITIKSTGISLLRDD